MSLAFTPNNHRHPGIGKLAEQFSRQSFTSVRTPDTGTEDMYERVLSFAIYAEQKIVEQRRRIEELELLARTDELTGLVNRRGLEAALTRVVSSAARHGEEGVICYLDIDDFKSVNDNYGHAAGDEALRLVAAILSDCTRAEDIAARVGGDEFVVVLTSASVSDGLRKATMLQKALSEASIETESGPLALNISLGMQAYDGTTSIPEVLNRADSAMYAQKSARKTRLVPIAT